MLKADYIDVNELKVKHLDGAVGTFSGSISANGAKVGGFSLDNGTLNWKAKDYFGEDSRSVKIGVSKDNNTGVVDVAFNGATIGRYGVKIVGSNMGGACIYASRNGSNTPDVHNTYAGYFDGGVHVNGNLYTNLIMANTIGTKVGPWAKMELIPTKGELLKKYLGPLKMVVGHILMDYK